MPLKSASRPLALAFVLAVVFTAEPPEATAQNLNLGDSFTRTGSAPTQPNTFDIMFMLNMTGTFTAFTSNFDPDPTNFGADRLLFGGNLPSIPQIELFEGNTSLGSDVGSAMGFTALISGTQRTAGDIDPFDALITVPNLPAGSYTLSISQVTFQNPSQSFGDFFRVNATLTSP